MKNIMFVMPFYLFCLALSLPCFAQSENVAVTRGQAPAAPGQPDASDAPTGDYRQPLWTAARMFPETRTYVIPRHSLEAEFWLGSETYRNGGGTKTLAQQEIEYGFARRWQFDFYLNEVWAPGQKFEVEGEQIEFRYALADWGKLPANPTLYFEYHPMRAEPDRLELRLLLGDNLAPGWHWSSNLGYEIGLWGDQVHQYTLTAATAKSLAQGQFAFGLEGKTEWTDTRQARGEFIREWYTGPVAQWKPCKGSHLDAVALIGLTTQSSLNQLLVIYGIDIQ